MAWLLGLGRKDIDMPWNYTALTGMTETTEDIPVYNLTVSGDHTYIVNSIVVHNKNLDEKLGNNSTASDYIKDFKKSDAPQFKGKSMEKKTKMAIAAYLASREKTEAYRKPTPAEIAADKKKDQKSGSDRYKSIKKKVYGNAMGGLKKESSAAFGQSMDRIQAKKTASQLTPAHKKKLAALHALMQKQKKTGNYKMESVEQMDESKKAVAALNMLAKKDSRVIPDQISMLNKIVMDGKHKDAHKFVRSMDKKVASTVAGILRKHGINEEKEEKDMPLKKVECKTCKGEGCNHCDDKGYHMKEACEYIGEEDGHHYVKVHGVRAGDHIILKTKAANKRAAVANVKKQWPKDKVTYHNEDLDKKIDKMKPTPSDAEVKRKQDFLDRLRGKPPVRKEETKMEEGMVRAVATARRMAGNMTGASKKIDKMKPAAKSGKTGRFSDNPRIAKKLQKYNEDVQSWQQFLESSCGGGSKRMKKESEKMSPAQKKHMDTDKDGDIDSTDLANLRNKKKS